MKRNTIILLFAILFASCAKLDLVPQGANTTDNFFKTEADAKASVNAAYADLCSHYLYNQFMEVLQSQGTDDCEWGNGRNTSNIDKNQLDKFTFDAGTNLVYQIWYTSFTIINRTNFAIKGISFMQDINAQKKAQYLGEAHFIRALNYFNLVRIYGKVPIVTEPTEALKNLQIARSPIADVYSLIINDFKTAADNLPVSYDAANSGRATKGAALTLLAKVYLTNKDYENAALIAKSAIDLNVYSLWSNYADIFLMANKNKKESIFEIQYATGTGNVNSSFSGYFKPSFDKRSGFGGYGDNPVTRNHFNAYSNGDLRKAVNVIEYSRTVAPIAPSSVLNPFYVAKYKDPEATNPENGGNNYIVTRYADLLLMYAEALSQIDETNPMAYEYFNKVRRRAFGYPINNTPSVVDLQPGQTKVQFLTEILKERRLELAFEGHRRFDLLRTNKLKEAMTVQDPSITVLDKHLLLPVPTLERATNNLLDQNDDY